MLHHAICVCVGGVHSGLQYLSIAFMLKFLAVEISYSWDTEYGCVCVCSVCVVKN